MVIIDNENKLIELRKLRETECFSVVNRGSLWYACLSNEQLAELRQWYVKWLDVTKTSEIPKKPEWLNNKIELEEILW